MIPRLRKVKSPRRVYSNPKTFVEFPDILAQWKAHVKEHKARVLRNGENPSDYPTRAVAYETANFGWILSRPDIDGKRHILVQF